MIRHTSTPHAPWSVVPADHQGVLHLVVVAVVDPQPGPDPHTALAAAPAAAESEYGIAQVPCS